MTDSSSHFLKTENASCTSSKMSTGKTYEISGEMTEWEDIMINKGIKTRDQIFIEKGLNPEDVSAMKC